MKVNFKPNEFGGWYYQLEMDNGYKHGWYYTGSKRSALRHSKKIAKKLLRNEMNQAHSVEIYPFGRYSG